VQAGNKGIAFVFIISGLFWFPFKTGYIYQTHNQLFIYGPIFKTKSNALWNWW